MVFKEENEKIPKSPAYFYKVFRDFLVTRIRFHLYHLYPDGGQKLSGMNGSVKPTAGSRVTVSRDKEKKCKISSTSTKILILPLFTGYSEDGRENFSSTYLPSFRVSLMNEQVPLLGK